MVHVIVEDKRDHGGTLWFSVLVDVGIQRNCAIGVQADASVVETWRRPRYAFHLLHSHENGGSRSRITNTVWRTTSPLAVTESERRRSDSVEFNPFLSS